VGPPDPARAPPGVSRPFPRDVHHRRSRRRPGRFPDRRFFALAEADDRSVVRAITAARNARSIAFHTAMGFTVTPPIPHYDGDSVPKVLFERSLPAPA